MKFQDLFKKQWSENNKLLLTHEKELSVLKTLYIGGGTPSLWGKKGISFLTSLLQGDQITFDENYEFTMEIDPGTCTEDDIQAWLDLGVNRFSVGVQTFDENLLKIMDRVHTMSDIIDLLTILKNKKCNYSIDLMLGLPESQDRNIKLEIDQLVEFNPSHFSVYILKARKNYLHYSNLPEDEFIRTEYLATCIVLDNLGYLQYEVSNFAKNNRRSQHNMRYWDYKDVAAIGANATGLLCFENHSLRYQWKSQSEGFQAELIEGSSLLVEKLFLGLRTSRGFNLKDFFSSKHQAKLESMHEVWKSYKYLKNSSNIENLKLNSLGFLMCDSIIDDIFKIIDF